MGAAEVTVLSLKEPRGGARPERRVPPAGRQAMSKKKKTPTTPTNLPALRIGSRVRCTDDRVEGRIVWANAASVKIEWDDGEQVTWRRDELATKPIEILDPEAPGAE